MICIRVRGGSLIALRDLACAGLCEEKWELGKEEGENLASER